MRYNQLGKNGPAFSVIGMGTWAAGGAWQFGYGKTDDAEICRTLHAGLDAGINWIDTAPAYGLGHAEELLGNALRGKRQQIFLATKCGLLWNKHGKIRKELSPQTIRQELEDSLRRLQTDVIDLYQIHWPDPARSMETVWHALAKLQKEGKIRWLGLSNCDAALTEKLHELHHVQSVQPQFNLFHRQADAELFPFCAQQQIGVLAYSPLHSGLLNEKFNPQALSTDDWRKRDPAFQTPYVEQFQRAVQQLSSIAQKYNKTVPQLALAWVLQHPTVTSAILGIRNQQQLAENLAALNFQILQTDLQFIDTITKSLPQVPKHK